MDNSLFLHYSQIAENIKNRRKIPSIKTLDDLKDFLKVEEDVERFHSEIEHSGDAEDWRLLPLLNFVGRPMVTASLMLNLLNQIEKEISKDE